MKTILLRFIISTAIRLLVRYYNQLTDQQKADFRKRLDELDINGGYDPRVGP